MYANEREQQNPPAISNLEARAKIDLKPAGLKEKRLGVVPEEPPKVARTTQLAKFAASTFDYDPLGNTMRFNYYDMVGLQSYDDITPQFTDCMLTVNQLNAIMQMWSAMIKPFSPPALAATGVLTGSGIIPLAFQLFAVQMALITIPAGANIQPGDPERYPHIGTLNFFTNLGAGNALFDEQYMTQVAQVFMPSKLYAGGIQYRLNPGYSVAFTFFGNPADLLTQDYNYTWDPLAVPKQVNIAAGVGVENDARV